MPLPLDLHALVHRRTVEWERLEFKAGWNPLQVLHTLCAFANDFHNLGGGYLVIGVTEQDGRPVLTPVGLDSASIGASQKSLSAPPSARVTRDEQVTPHVSPEEEGP